jgi:hypothetical protein
LCEDAGYDAAEDLDRARLRDVRRTRQNRSR